LTLVGVLPKDDVASDLTSCSFPLSVLASSAYVDFETVLKKDVELTWTATEDVAITGYQVQYSTDGEHWRTLASPAKNSFYNGVSATYHYTDRQYVAGNNFYRIAQLYADGRETYSIVKVVNTRTDRKIYIGPNPASNTLYVYNYNGGNYLAQVFDQSGRLVYYTILGQSQQGVDISRLPKGSYVLHLTSSADNTVSSSHFLKQ